MFEKKSKLVNRDDFLSLKDLPFEDVAVPEFGPYMVARVKAMDALRYYRFGVELRKRGVDFYRPLLVAFTVVDDAGDPVFSVEDVESLSGMDYEVIQRLSDAAARVEKLRKGDQDLVTENFEKPQG